MKKLFLLVVLLLMAAPVLCYAGGEGGPRKAAESFFAGMQKGDIDGAFDTLFTGSHILENKPQVLEEMKKTTQTNLSFYGKMIGSEQLMEETYGSSVVRLVYLLKMDKHPLTVEFYFYKPKNTWFISNVLFNDDFALLKRNK
ncbi:MAG TPA: hypothetical protein PLR60_11145 [Syntrophorhabdaceae bacterium]|nr:hypothetical protein [Syntrophorhabdaceae bacterium]